MEVEQYTDEQIVSGILSNDKRIIEFFFFKKCSYLLTSIIKNVFDYHVQREELISELYLYIQNDNWCKLRQFDYRSQLITWLSVVAIRYFIKKRERLIDNDITETQYISKEKGYSIESELILKMDVLTLLENMENKRYQYILQTLILEDREPQELADELRITVDNLYNIKRRALASLRNMVLNNEK